MPAFRVSTERIGPQLLRFFARESNGTARGSGELLMLPGANPLLLGINTNKFGGKGSGAAEALRIARIRHAFEEAGASAVDVRLDLEDSKLAKALGVYRRLGFRRVSKLDDPELRMAHLRLVRATYLKLKEGGAYSISKN